LTAIDLFGHGQPESCKALAIAAAHHDSSQTPGVEHPAVLADRQNGSQSDAGFNGHFSAQCGGLFNKYLIIAQPEDANAPHQMRWPGGIMALNAAGALSIFGAFASSGAFRGSGH